MLNFPYLHDGISVSFWNKTIGRVAGVTLACAMAFGPNAAGAQQTRGAEQAESRLSRLRNYFRTNRSPLERWSDAFLAAADKHNLDWRLLPSIAMIESGGGRAYRRNNIFGWRSGRAQFTSVNQAIEYVATRLSESPIYRGRPVADLLRIYNPARPIYAKKIMAVMESIGPELRMSAAIPAQ
ncbi:MAG: glucosaminidase domain-containing protein [Bryobacterales bacterium]|nr:glucosaminidase domain-containing protein [Bryobacterales bacterium]